MRVTNAPASRKRRTRMIRAAKGFRMRRSKLYRYASDALDHGRQYAYRDRKTKKRNFRALWQIRINAAARAAGLTYSRFMEGLKAAKVALDRKVLADLAAQDNAAFSELVKVAQEALPELRAAPDLAALEHAKGNWIGVHGRFTALMKQLGSLPKEDRPAAGRLINQTKFELEAALAGRREEIERQAALPKEPTDF